jgi:hypothetical protein
MHGDHNLENRIRVEVYLLDLIVVQDTAGELVGRKAKSTLEEGG